LSAQEQESLLSVTRYVGSALHKRSAGNYGFHPPANPRPHKSLCDDLRPVPLPEAQRLFAAGIGKSMVSAHREGHLPKYVWSVDEWGEVYEAKLGNEGYHGYRLDEDGERAMRALVLHEWSTR
jgi:hypothetical protein